MELENCQLRDNRLNISQSNPTSIGYTHVLCCPCCMFFTLSFANLHKHALAHDANQLSSYRTYTCSKCLSTSTERYLMLEHVNIYHRNTKRPVELTEEIHTVLRKSDSTIENKSPVESDINSPVDDCRMNFPMKKRVFTQTFRCYSKLHQRLKNRSRLNRNAVFCGNKFVNNLPTEKKIKTNDTIKMKPDDPIPNENEPIDMTMKSDSTHSKDKLNDGIANDSESKLPQDFSIGGHNFRSYLFDVFSKNSVPPGLPQSIMLRYLTAQFQSFQAAKYFANSHFLNPPTLLNHQDANFSQKLFDNHLSSSVQKSPEGNSTSQRNLHRNNFSPLQNHILLEWYDKHKHKPYPSTEETKHLAALCGLSYPQVKKWFANKRARSSFYQKDDIISCQTQARYNMLRFPLQMSNRLNPEVVKSLEAQFANSLDNLALVSSSSHDDSVISA